MKFSAIATGARSAGGALMTVSIGLYASGWPEQIKAHPQVVLAVFVLGAGLLALGFLLPKRLPWAIHAHSVAPPMSIQINPVFNNSPSVKQTSLSTLDNPQANERKEPGIRESLDAGTKTAIMTPQTTTSVRQMLAGLPIQNRLVKPEHNVQCVGFRVLVDDPFAIAVLSFQNVPTPGKLMGKFEYPRLRVVYYEHLTGQEIADMCPLQWWDSEKDRPAEINARESHAVIATCFQGKWQASEINEPSEDFDNWHKLHSIDLPPGDFRIIARLSGAFNLSIAPVTGVLTLSEDGTASFQRMSD